MRSRVVLGVRLLLGGGLLRVRLRLPVRRLLRRERLPRWLLAGHLLARCLLPRSLLPAGRLALAGRILADRVLGRLSPRRGLLTGAPRLPPGLARGRCGLLAGDPRIAVGGQHNALSRGLTRRIVRVAALSALRHRDSYDQLTYGSVGHATGSLSRSTMSP
ncbi:hypothetical protein ACWGJZ_42030, partial [Streptomyces rimosus]